MEHLSNIEEVLDPMFLEIPINNPPLSNTSSQSKSQTTPNTQAKASKSKKITKYADRKEPHIWTSKQKTKLLDLIIDYTRHGHGTDNANLKKDAWVALTNDLNNVYNTSLDIQQVQNQKGALRKSYQDFCFLRDQSGFGWDTDCATPTADSSTWDDLIQAHP